MGSVESLLAKARIRELPRRRVCTVSPSTSLGEVYRLLDEEHSVAVLVCEGNELVGIFTERDILNRTAFETNLEAPISDFASEVRASLTTDHRLADAIAVMYESGYRHIPLPDSEGARPGLIGGRDILRLIADYYPETLLNLPPRLNQQMTRAEGG